MKREHEITEIENDSMRTLLSGLKRIEAPGDFDFRVKARIAHGRPADRSASLIPAWLRLAVPIILLVVVGGYFGFRDLNSSTAVVAGVQQPETTSVSEIPVKAGIVTPPSDKALTAQVDLKPANSSEKSHVVIPEKLVSRTANSNKNAGGGSYEESFKESRVLRPKGLDSHRISPRRKDIIGTGALAAKDMLNQWGIDASYSGSWKVGSIKQNSIGERSGVKSGDVIEAINDQNLTEKTTLASPFSGKSIRVRRDGKSVQIDLKP